MSPDSVLCQGPNTFKCPSIHIVRELNISPSTVSRASGREETFKSQEKCSENCSKHVVKRKIVRIWYHILIKALARSSLSLNSLSS